jgi:hypothetical protein
MNPLFSRRVKCIDGALIFDRELCAVQCSPGIPPEWDNTMRQGLLGNEGSPMVNCIVVLFQILWNVVAAIFPERAIFAQDHRDTLVYELLLHLLEVRNLITLFSPGGIALWFNRRMVIGAPVIKHLAPVRVAIHERKLERSVTVYLHHHTTSDVVLG